MAPLSVQYVYRMVLPKQWDLISEDWTAAFALRDSEEGLSVYCCNTVDAAGVLAKWATACLARRADDPKKQQRWIRDNGATPDEMVSLGYRVIRLHVDEFKSRGFRLSQVDADGHLEIFPADQTETERERFLLFAPTWSSLATRVLPP